MANSHVCGNKMEKLGAKYEQLQTNKNKTENLAL